MIASPASSDPRLLVSAGAAEVDFKTFTGLYKKKMKTARDLEADMRAAFEAIDKEGSVISLLLFRSTSRTSRSKRTQTPSFF